MFEDESGMLISQQPSDKTPLILFTTHHCKLVEILGLSLRAFYSTEKSRVRMGLVGHNWESEIVAELESRLNQWLDGLPDACKREICIPSQHN
jgi:hypothetical protein